MPGSKSPYPPHIESDEEVMKKLALPRPPDPKPEPPEPGYGYGV
jgi:hypothetical protein